jgi:hypothetical protein
MEVQPNHVDRKFGSFQLMADLVDGICDSI